VTTYNLSFEARGSQGIYQISGIGLSPSFDVASLASSELETLTTPGVNGTRFRTVRRDWQLMIITTTIPCIDLKDVLTQEDVCAARIGSVGRLTIRLDATVSRVWEKATLVAAQTRRTGKIIAAGVDAPYSLELTASFQRQGVIA